MKKLLGILSLVFYLASYGQVKKDILFLGNSYTYVNDLPKLLQDIAISQGDSVYFDQNTPGGYTLQGHSTNATSLSKIKSRSWDVVVLQDQSQRPSFSPTQVAADVLPYAKKLVDAIKINDSCTKSMFYMTWGRKYGDQQNCPFYSPVCTYSGMQQRLRESYIQMAVDNKACTAPVGMAWKESIRVDSNLNLYASDNSHPSLAGSYLAACVFYASIFHKTSVGAFHPLNLSSSTAFILQNIADQTVFDSLQVWQIDTIDLIKSRFTFTLDRTEVTFVNYSSSNANRFFWNFGDGTTSTLKNPVHIYPGAGNYQVSLTSSKGCLEETITKQIEMFGTQVEQFNQENLLKIHPNPAKDKVTINLLDGKKYSIEILNMKGQVILSSESNQSKTILKLEHFKRGLYMLLIYSENDMLIEKLVLE